MVFVDKINQNKIQAEQFKIGNIDNVVDMLSSECTEIDILNLKTLKAKFPFGVVREIIAHDGDYIIMGQEIPNTIPKLLHEFHVIREECFAERYLKQKEEQND